MKVANQEHSDSSKLHDWVCRKQGERGVPRGLFPLTILLILGLWKNGIERCIKLISGDKMVDPGRL